MTRQEFMQHVHAAASRSSEQSGMPVMVTVAQAALESNWGQSKLSQEANNYFGIKAHGKHDRIQMSTEECEHGRRIVVEAEFAKYPSLLDCILCRDGILRRGACYAGARQTRGDEAGFIREIAKHWATDPKYAEKLQAVLIEVKGLVE
jgi:flagellum-specific peptidoglycan hydrolase FlgJ